MYKSACFVTSLEMRLYHNVTAYPFTMVGLYPMGFILSLSSLCVIHCTLIICSIQLFMLHNSNEGRSIVSGSVCQYMLH